MREWEQQGTTEFQVTCIGNKGFGFMQRLGAKVVSHVVQIGDTPHLEKLIGAIKVMIDCIPEWRTGCCAYSLIPGSSTP
jgi:F-type H+-transporting ATPase subunit gamma